MNIFMQKGYVWFDRIRWLELNIWRFHFKFEFAVFRKVDDDYKVIEE